MRVGWHRADAREGNEREEGCKGGAEREEQARQQG